MTKPTPSFIGEKEIKEVEQNDSGAVTVHFKERNSEPLTINSELLELIARPVKNEGSIVDVITHCLASKYLAELSDYGLEFYMVEHVTQGMRTYAHNLRETAIGRAFGCSGALDMTLDQLTD